MTRRRLRPALAAAASALALLSAGAAAAQDAEDELAAIRAELEEQRRLIEAQWARIEAQDREIARQRAIIEAATDPGRAPPAVASATPGTTASRTASAAGSPAPPARARPVVPGALRAAERTDPGPEGPPPPAAETPTRTASAAPAGASAADEERPDSERQVDQLLVDQGGVLLPPGTFQVEANLEYAGSTIDRVNVAGFSIFDAIVIGTIRVDEIDRDILTGAWSARYGVWRRVQAEVRAPYVYRRDEEIAGIGTGEPTRRGIEGYGVGDVSATLSWQPISAEGWRPATILRATAQLPTGVSAFQIDRVAVEEDGPETALAEAPRGGGFYTGSVGATFVWPSDPVVLFAGGGYVHSFERTFADFGRVDPGDGFDLTAGVNLALNDRVSTSFTFQNQRRFTSTLNGEDLLGTRANDARLAVGSSIALSDRVSLVTSVQMGLTDESPDFVVSARVPITFQTGINRRLANLFRRI